MYIRMQYLLMYLKTTVFYFVGLLYVTVELFNNGSLSWAFTGWMALQYTLLLGRTSAAVNAEIRRRGAQ